MNSLLKYLSVVFFSGVLLAACGSGGGSAGSASASGSEVSGSVSLSSDFSSARMNAIEEDVSSSEPYAGAVIQLLDTEGNVIAETETDENGNFNFSGVEQGDYTIQVVDPETGEVVTEMDVSIVEGDDVLIEGVISSSETDWTVDFVANSADLQNEAQNEKAVNIAMACDATLDEVLAMREEGMGWGAIAQELGAHPSTLGLGHSDGFSNNKKSKTEENNVGPSSNGNGNGKGNKGGKGGGKPDNTPGGGKPNK